MTALLGALAHYALIKALDHAEAGAVQPYSYTLLVWVTILGVWCSATFPTIGRWRARPSSWPAGSTPGTTTGGASNAATPEATSPPSIGSITPVTQRDSSEAR